MSVFGVCSWWSSQCSDLLDHYDVASLLCARFGLDAQEKDYIIVGSQSGYLNIFYPSPQLEIPNGSTSNAFKPTDLLLEIQLKEPILGVYAGRFSGNLRNETQNQLGILHPNSIAIYNIQTMLGLAEHGAQLRLQLQVEYKFRHVAFSLCKGHFGQIKGREFFCVVHLDGTLTFYEQDGISYKCKFPGHRTIPSPVVYCERTDSFFRLSATWNLECFSYQDLSHSSIHKSSYKPTWSVCLGEGVVDMCIVQVKVETSWILVLGERNLLCLDDNGKMNFILKLDYVPKCFHTFMVGYYWEPTARLITAVISDTSKLFIYEEANIIWGAQYQSDSPVAVQRSNVHGLPGAIVTLGPTGQLNIGFLGSEPFLFEVPPLKVEDMAFIQSHKELQQLEDEIKEAVDVRDMDSLNQQAMENVRLTFSIRSTITDDLDTLLLDVPAEVAVKELPSASGTLRIKSKVNVSQLQVILNMPAGVRCSQDTLFMVDVAAGTVKEIELDFYVAELLHIHTARVDAVVSYVNTRGIPRVIQQSAFLPLTMFYKLHQPQKAAGIKLTYTITSRNMQPRLSAFFPDFVSNECDTQALGLILMCPAREKLDEIITIVVAKNSNRLRIQSDYLEAFPLILERLVQTTLSCDESQGLIKTDKKKPKKGALNRRVQSIIAAPFIPVQEILHRIDMHHETQQDIRKQTNELDELWLQFKTLQRKLQEKTDDEPKETLVMQIEENYDNLILEGDKLVEMRKDERKQRCDLNCGLTLANWIIMSLNMEERVINVITSVLTTPVEDWMELSWEESMAPGIDMLHHFGPLSRSKAFPANGLTEPSGVQESFDYVRLRRHFATLFDRIVRLAATEPNKIQQNTEKFDERSVPKKKDEIHELNRMLALDSEHSHNLKLTSPISLEAVEDDGEEYDEDDLQQLGYRKDYGSEINKKAECSEWINEDFELPTNEELFSDLGIWW